MRKERWSGSGFMKVKVFGAIVGLFLVVIVMFVGFAGLLLTVIIRVFFLVVLMIVVEVLFMVIEFVFMRCLL